MSKITDQGSVKPFLPFPARKLLSLQRTTYLYRGFRYKILWCGLLLLLSACSVPQTIRPILQSGDVGSSAQLLNIRIERWGELRFSGLLALREYREGLYALLLDASGAKLFEVDITSDGQFRLVRANGGFRDSDLPGYLAGVLARIYLQEPESLPCSGSWLYRICREAGSNQNWSKYLEIVSLSAWRVDGEKAVEDAQHATVSYSQSWIGVRIVLQPTDLLK